MLWNKKFYIDIFINCLTELHCRHLKSDIAHYINSITEKMVHKWSTRSSLAEKLVNILVFVADKQEIATDDIVSEFGFTSTTAKRYMRQHTEFGYLEAHGCNKNRSYSIVERLTGDSII